MGDYRRRLGHFQSGAWQPFPKHEGPHKIKSHQIKHNKLSPAIRASGPPLFHYEWDVDMEPTCLSIREYAALQLFPNDCEFFSTLESKKRQVGNSLPCGLATAIGRSVFEVGRFVWKGEEIDLLGGASKRRKVDEVTQLKRQLPGAEDELRKHKQRKEEVLSIFMAE